MVPKGLMKFVRRFCLPTLSQVAACAKYTLSGIMSAKKRSAQPSGSVGVIPP